MKICLALPASPAGGSYTFMRNFQDYLTQENIPWTNNLHEDYDLLFLNSWQTPFKQAYEIKQSRPTMRVIHRIDGVAQDYGRYDGVDWLQRDVNTLADQTIFQSHYSYDTTRTKYKLIHQEGPIIFNPVDVERFSPIGNQYDLPKKTKPRILTISWSKNRNKGTWRLPELARLNPDLEFLHAGQTTFEASPPNLLQLGRVAHTHLPDLMRSADIFLNLSLYDPCPNVVIEALASGLPILYMNSGGTPELVGKNAGLAITDDESFRPQCDLVLAQLDIYQANARQHASTSFTFSKIFRQYLDAMQDVPRHPLPSVQVRSRAWVAQRSYDIRQQVAKWRRILTGKQSLFKERHAF